MLRLIAAGELLDCADIAASAAYGSCCANIRPYLAGQALLATGDSSQRRAYAEHIKRNADTVPTEVLEAAVEGLFPDFISVEDLIAFFASGALKDGQSRASSLKWSSSDLVGRISSPSDLEKLIGGLLDLDACEHPANGAFPVEKDETIEAFLLAAADRLLALAGPDMAPHAAIDAVLHCRDRLGMTHARDNDKRAEAARRLHESPTRRQAAFWRAAETLSTSSALNGRNLDTVHAMAFLGWSPDLQPADLVWLLADGPSRLSPSEQRLAANAAMDIWARQGRPEDILRRIKDCVQTCAEMSAVVDAWLTPPPHSSELEESTRRLEEASAEHEQRRAEQEDGWVAFVDGIRNDPDPLSKLLPPSPGTVSQALGNLWALLREANRGRNRFVIESVAPLAELAGEKVADAFAEATRRLWRERPPLLKSARPLSQRNQLEGLDLLGVAAVSIEAARNPTWVNRLSAEQARRAAEYATLEINELPRWIESLASAWPTPVRDALMTEILCELDTPGDQTHRPCLDYIERGPLVVARVVAAPIWREVESRKDLGPGHLRPLLSVALRGLDVESLPGAYTLAIERFASTADPATAAQYLGFTCAINAEGATQALVEKLATLDEAGKTALVLLVLPQIFGSRLSLTPGRGVDMDIPTLLRLVILAYRTVRVENDTDRTNGGVYSPNLRDNAEDARTTAFNRLVLTPGRASYDALRTLTTEPDFPVDKQRLEALARERAALDSETTAWAGDDALLFERRWEKEPSTGRELQMLAMQRLEDIQHDLLHADFAQGPTLSSLPDEAAVQAWLADRMRLTQGWSYSVEREPETVAAKKPDIVLTARAAAAKVAVEIKVAETWTLPQLETALEAQLCGQYLRARDCREGVLVLVHQTPRRRGWKLPDGTCLSFPKVVERLKEHANKIRQASSFGPQPEVAVIDVSSCARLTQDEPTGKTHGTKATAAKAPSRVTNKRGPSAKMAERLGQPASSTAGVRAPSPRRYTKPKTGTVRRT